MRNEMDLMNMDERQRLAWFMANRGTVIAVGAVWLGMIGWELTHGRVPTFLLIMVPVIAALRAGLYFFYSSKSLVASGAARDPSLVRYGKAAAALLLAAAILLPIYSVAGLSADKTYSRYAWDLVKEDAAALIVLAFVYLWPFLVFALSRLRSRHLLQALVQYVEPALAVLSAIIILWIPQLIFDADNLYFIPVPLNAKPEWGCYLAVAANGLYLVSWLAGLLRPWGTQDG
jgi:hypothetical protein